MTDNAFKKLTLNKLLTTAQALALQNVAVSAVVSDDVDASDVAGAEPLDSVLLNENVIPGFIVHRIAPQSPRAALVSVANTLSSLLDYMERRPNIADKTQRVLVIIINGSNNILI